MNTQDFLNTFAHLADAPGGVDRLRELILQLAVRGKLVEQDPEDEPASVLLERIGKHNNKRTKLQTHNLPFCLPSNWCWTRFENIATIATNGVDPKDFPNYPHIGPANIEKGTGKLLPFNSIAEDGVISVKHHFFAGQILYSKIRPNLAKNVIIDFEGLCSADMYPLEPHIYTNFFQAYLLSPVFLSMVINDDNRLAMPKVNQSQLRKVLVPIPPLAEQKRIVARVDELMELCDELEIHKSARAEIHGELHASALNQLTSAEDAADFAKNWVRIRDNFDLLFDTPESIDALRQAILELAVRGKLVEQDPDDEPAEVLLERIRGKKKQLYKAKAFQKQKAQLSNEPEFGVPPTWMLISIEEVFYPMSTSQNKIKSSEVEDAGSHPVVDQGQAFIAGYTDKSDKLIELPGPVIVFGDHTCNIKYVDFDFVGGADGIKVLRPILIFERYLYWFLHTVELRERGYARHYTLLRKELIPLPPLAEQKRIVARVDELMELCDEMEELIRQRQVKAKRFAEAVVHAAVLDEFGGEAGLVRSCDEEKAQIERALL